MKLLNTIAEMLTLIIIIALVISIPVFLLWNWLMPEIFGLTEITFWQAMGVSALSSILFKANDGGK